MSTSKYDIFFYNEKRVIKFSKFDNFKAASEYLLANMSAYMESEHFLSNTDSSYCATVFDVGSSRFIQLLGPIGDEEKLFLEKAFKKTGNRWL